MGVLLKILFWLVFGVGIIVVAVLLFIVIGFFILVGKMAAASLHFPEDEWFILEDLPVEGRTRFFGALTLLLLHRGRELEVRPLDALSETQREEIQKYGFGVKTIRSYEYRLSSKTPNPRNRMKPGRVFGMFLTPRPQPVRAE